MRLVFIYTYEEPLVLQDCAHDRIVSSEISHIFLYGTETYKV